MDRHPEPPAFRVFTRRDLDRIPQLARLPAEERLAMKAVSAVLPFRVNPYVVDELIRWEDAPADPIYQLTFPQREMLEPPDLEHLMALIRGDAPAAVLAHAAREIQARLNPHPAGQVTLNAAFDEKATWLNHLKPALGAKTFAHDQRVRGGRRPARLPVVAEAGSTPQVDLARTPRSAFAEA